MDGLPKKQMGNAFELLTKLYFKINPVYSFYDEVWLLSEVPSTVFEYLGLPSHDLGIDLIAKQGDEYHPIQCKYHSEKNSSITFNEVSTFISLLEGNDKFTQGYSLLHGCFSVYFVADIALHKGATDVFGNGLAFFNLHVGHHHLAAVGRQHACRAFAQARCAAGDDENLACDVHGKLLCGLVKGVDMTFT